MDPMEDAAVVPMAVSAAVMAFSAAASLVFAAARAVSAVVTAVAAEVFAVVTLVLRDARSSAEHVKSEEVTVSSTFAMDNAWEMSVVRAAFKVSTIVLKSVQVVGLAIGVVAWRFTLFVAVSALTVVSTAARDVPVASASALA